MEFVRMGIIYAHLISCCVAIGLVLTSDIAMIKGLFDDDQGVRDEMHLQQLQRIVSRALVGLWISGISVTLLDASTQGFTYFLNPKLQAKIAIVVLLTINGYVLHKTVLPGMQRAGSLLNLEFKPRLIATFTGVVSGVSWFFAALLGVGKPLSWKYSLTEILAGFPVLILLGFIGMLLITAMAKQESASDYELSEREPLRNQ